MSSRHGLAGIRAALFALATMAIMASPGAASGAQEDPIDHWRMDSAWSWESSSRRWGRIGDEEVRQGRSHPNGKITYRLVRANERGGVLHMNILCAERAEGGPHTIQYECSWVFVNDATQAFRDQPLEVRVALQQLDQTGCTDTDLDLYPYVENWDMDQDNHDLGNQFELRMTNGRSRFRLDPADDGALVRTTMTFTVHRNAPWAPGPRGFFGFKFETRLWHQFYSVIYIYEPVYQATTVAQDRAAGHITWSTGKIGTHPNPDEPSTGGGVFSADYDLAADDSIFTSDFQLAQGRTYRIETSDLSEGCDTLIHLRVSTNPGEADPDDPIIARNDDHSDVRGPSRIEWTCDQAAAYYVEIVPYEGRVGTFHLSVTDVTEGGARPPGPTAPDAAGVTTADIIGHFAGNWGDMELRVVGEEIWGTYTHDRGTLVMSWSDDGVLRGWWSEDPSRLPQSDAGEVEFRFIMRDSTVNLDGRWRYGTTGTWSEDWDLQHVDTPIPQELSDRFNDPSAFRRHP